MTSKLCWAVFLLLIFAVAAPAAAPSAGAADDVPAAVQGVDGETFGLCAQAEVPMSLPGSLDDATAREPLWLTSHCGSEPSVGSSQCEDCYAQCSDWQDWCICICFDQGGGPGCRFNCLTGYEACAQQCDLSCT